MSNHPPTPLNPSQAVERIREIIVGRQIERLERRIERLEEPREAVVAAPVEDRLLAAEARLEALRENVHRLADATREEGERRSAVQREEIQRLAAQIQRVAASRAAESSAPAIQQLEQKLGVWLAGWRDSFLQHSADREREMARHLQRELGALRQWIEARFADLERRMPESASVEERFSRIAAAARALAESAAPASPRF